MKQKFNYHTHTYRCGHAIGTEEDMIKAAIEAGFDTIGVSEHLGYRNWDHPRERIPYLELDDYLATMNQLKIKYKDQIEVCIGFECEYFSDMKEHLFNMKEKCDYLICGQHAFDRGGKEKGRYYDKKKYNSDEYIEFMASQVCEGITLGLFKYIAHPDYFMLSGCELSVRKAEAIRRIAQCAKEHNVILEINIKGMKFGKKDYHGIESYLYPNHLVYKIIGEVGTNVCFGYDAHHPQALLDRSAEEILKKEFAPYHLQYVEELSLTNLR